MTVDGIVLKSDFLLTKVLITGDGQNSGIALAYAGVDTGGEKKLTLRVTANKSELIDLIPGIVFKDGVYVDLTTIDDVVFMGYVLKP